MSRILHVTTANTRVTWHLVLNHLLVIRPLDHETISCHRGYHGLASILVWKRPRLALEHVVGRLDAHPLADGPHVLDGLDQPVLRHGTDEPALPGVVETGALLLVGRLDPQLGRLGVMLNTSAQASPKPPLVL
jgi:hypothetical protein